MEIGEINALRSSRKLREEIGSTPDPSDELVDEYIKRIAQDATEAMSVLSMQKAAQADSAEQARYNNSINDYQEVQNRYLTISTATTPGEVARICLDQMNDARRFAEEHPGTLSKEYKQAKQAAQIWKSLYERYKGRADNTETLLSANQ